MTTPYTGSHPNVDPAQIIAGNSRLHDSWELRYAIIVDTLSTSQGIARYDGDLRNTVPVISLIGQLITGWRVAVIFIPPSGNYVISVVDMSPDPITKFDSSDTVDTTTSTTYTTAGAPVVGTPFIASPSGRVEIHWSGELSNSTGSFTLISPRVGTDDVLGAGTAILSESDSNTARTDTTATVRSANFHLLEGLAPGGLYNCALLHRVGGGTGGISRRRVMIVPTP